MLPQQSQAKTYGHPQHPSRSFATHLLSPTQPTVPFPQAQRIEKLITISRQAASLSRDISDSLFTSPSDKRAARKRIATLKRDWGILKAQVDYELSTMGYQLTNINQSMQPPSSTNNFTHKYGPMSPRYTVDKALKRKRENKTEDKAPKRPQKKRRNWSESDFVESDSETEHKVVGAVDPLTTLCSVPLPREEKGKMYEWSWREAASRGGVGSEEMVSPMGTSFFN
ncbi:hypothetical protein N0V90_004135 [Kalmusia sp. IMI 367209]|nr:hypothetical protein N0V90_004135 [Kalmusia sp. IMI 367209]